MLALKNLRNISDLIFEKILQILVEHPQILDDESVYRQVTKYPAKKRIIEKKFRETEYDFMELLMAQCSQFPFLIHHYYAIEDAWVKALASVTLYNDVFEQSHTIPRDKYMLYGSIVKALYTQQDSSWTFDDVMSLLKINALIKPTEKTAYERTLIAILILLDDEKTRLAIIDILKEKYSDKSSFNQLLLGLFNDAVELDNPGLISWILNHSVSLLSQEMINNAIEISAGCFQWRLVDVFLKQAPDVLEAKTLALVVERAVEKGEIFILNNLLKNHSNRLKKDAVNKSFILAATHNQREALGLLVNYYDFLSKDDAMVAKGLGVALDCQHIATAQFLIHIKDSSLVKDKIESLLKKAFKDKNVETID